MQKQKTKHKSKWRIFVYFYLLLILMSLLTVASYTWFSLSRTPRVSDLYMFVNSPAGLELSTDPKAEEWELQLDFREMVDVTTTLRPITWSDTRKQFIVATHGIDGRIMPTNYWQPLTDEHNANKDNRDGYYIKATFFARTGQAVDVSLSPAVEVEEGIDGSGTYVIGTPVWNQQNILHSNGGKGAENAIRIGFRITPVDEEGMSKNEGSEFFIYEPNCDLHLEAGQGYAPTPSIDGAANLIDTPHLIRQTASTWAEAYPVQRNVVVHTLGEFLDEPVLFSLDVGEMVKIELYIWLEGQDIDCTNRIQEAQILASIQFAAETGNQSGLVPIE